MNMAPGLKVEKSLEQNLKDSCLWTLPILQGFSSKNTTFRKLDLFPSSGKKVALMMFRAVFWVVLPCKRLSSLMMEAVRTSETSVDNRFTRQYNPEDSSEHHTRRRENLKSRIVSYVSSVAEVKL
jgi:hypothetical protein